MDPASKRVAALVVAETRDRIVSALTFELLATARVIAAASGGTVAAALMIDDRSAADTLIAHGADAVYLCGPDGAEDAYEEYEGEVWLPSIARLAREISPRAVLAGDTAAGSELAPRLAVRLQTAAATRCLSVDVDGDRLSFTRACYGGNVRETLAFGSQPAVVTMKAGGADAQPDPERSGSVIRVIAEPVARRTRVVAREREPAGRSLEDAKIIVAGGRGLEGPEGFEVLSALADVLGAAVGSSRVPCDLGWCPHSWQIGLTGKTVTPDLYLAVGISGAGHHMAGCGNAKNIVAINSDPDAAIFRQARFGVVGDYRSVVPALASAVAQIKDRA